MLVPALVVLIILCLSLCDAAFVGVSHQRACFRATGNIPFLQGTTHHNDSKRSTVSLYMGKGFKRGGKQADLARKMKLAKQQKQQQQSDEPAKLSEEEIKERNDRLRFEELLKSKAATVLNAYSEDGYLSQEQEEEEITAARSGADRLFEGDPAPPMEVFEDLVLVETGLPLNKKGTKRLHSEDYLVILTDPRPKSYEFRQMIQQISMDLKQDVLANKLMVVNADTPAENRRWLKKNGITRVKMYSDQEMNFMKAFTALGDQRYAVCMFIIARGKIQKLAREVDGVLASRVIQNAIGSLEL